MEKAKKHIDIDFELKGIELGKFAMNSHLQSETTAGSYSFSIDIQLFIKSDVNEIGVGVDVKIMLDDSKIEAGCVRTICIFSIPSLGEYKKKAQLPDHFLDKLSDISVSTTRGIMFSLFKGTFLHKAILPVIDPAKLVQKT